MQVPAGDHTSRTGLQLPSVDSVRRHWSGGVQQLSAGGQSAWACLRLGRFRPVLRHPSGWQHLRDLQAEQVVSLSVDKQLHPFTRQVPVPVSGTVSVSVGIPVPPFVVCLSAPPAEMVCTPDTAVPVTPTIAPMCLPLDDQPPIELTDGDLVLDVLKQDLVGGEHVGVAVRAADGVLVSAADIGVRSPHP